jgi:F420-non-reducing hydrogenase small subunit
MQHKPKIAICWLGGCGGCDEAIVDLNENILEVAAQAELVFWPVAMDYKYHHIEAMQNGEIALSIVNGNVRNSDHEEVLRLLRKKSRLLLAFGACACFGGTPGLANLADRETIYNWVYRDAPTVYNPAGCLPQAKTRVGEYELTLPELYDKVYPVNHMVR